MSIKLMASAWELGIPATEKLVLLCLCDFANDNGICWPAIKTIATKCSLSDRTVQLAIKRLRADGYCTWNDAPGKAHQFRLDPRRICTPEGDSPPKSTAKPPKEIHHTPEGDSPKPSRTIKEPSKGKNSILDFVGDEKRPKLSTEEWHNIAEANLRKAIKANDWAAVQKWEDEVNRARSKLGKPWRGGNAKQVGDALKRAGIKA